MNNYEKNTLYSNTVENNVDVYSSLLHKPSQAKQPKVTEQWSNNIYVFNKNNTKLLPCAQIEADNMIRSYVNLTHIQEGVKPRSRKTISRRLYPNKIYSSKPHIAHTNYEGNITVFIYDRKQKYLNYISNDSYDTITQLWKPKKVFNPHNKNREETNVNKAIFSYSPRSYKGRKFYNNADRENSQIEFRFNTISRRLDSKKNTNDVTDRRRKPFPITNRWEKDTRKSNIVERSIDLGPIGRKNINVPNKEIESKKIRELDKVSRDVDIKSGTTERSVVRRVFPSYPIGRGGIEKPTHNKKSESYENSLSSKPDSRKSNTRAPFSIVKNNNIFKRYMSSETHANIKSKKQGKNLPIINRVYRWSKERNIFKPHPIGPIGRDKHKSSLIAFVSVNPTIVNKINTKKSSVFILPKPLSGKIKPRPLEEKKSKLFFLSYLSNLPYFLSSKYLVRKIRNMKRLKINKKNSSIKMKKLEVKRNFGIKMKKLNINKKNLGIKMKRLSKSSSLFMTRSKVTLKKSKSCRLYRKRLQVRKVFVVKQEKAKLYHKPVHKLVHKLVPYTYRPSRRDPIGKGWDKMNKLNKPKGRMNKLNLLKIFFNKLSVIKPKTKKHSISEIYPSCQSLSLFYALNVIDKTTMNKVAFFVDKINHSYKLNEDEKKYIIEFISNTLAVRDISFSSFSQSTYPLIKDNNNIYISNIIQEQNIAKVMLTDKKNLMYLQTVQQMYYNINKSNTWFALGMKSILSQIYNKTITINIVNSKYIYLNADMFAELIASKLRIRSNNVLRIMKKALSMVRLGSRKDFIASIFNVEPSSIPIGFDFIPPIGTPPYPIGSPIGSPIGRVKRKTISLNNNFLNSGSKFNLTNSLSSYSVLDGLRYIKHQIINGVRIEASGRISRRITASRSLNKILYIGGLRDVEARNRNSSYLFSLQYRKSNVQYGFIASKRIIGSFGLKVLVSSSNKITKRYNLNRSLQNGLNPRFILLVVITNKSIIITLLKLLLLTKIFFTLKFGLVMFSALAGITTYVLKTLSNGDKFNSQTIKKISLIAISLGICAQAFFYIIPTNELVAELVSSFLGYFSYQYCSMPLSDVCHKQVSGRFIPHELLSGHTNYILDKFTLFMDRGEQGSSSSQQEQSSSSQQSNLQGQTSATASSSQAGENPIDWRQTPGLRGLLTPTGIFNSAGDPLNGLPYFGRHPEFKSREAPRISMAGIVAERPFIPGRVTNFDPTLNREYKETEEDAIHASKIDGRMTWYLEKIVDILGLENSPLHAEASRRSRETTANELRTKQAFELKRQEVIDKYPTAELPIHPEYEDIRERFLRYKERYGTPDMDDTNTNTSANTNSNTNTNRNANTNPNVNTNRNQN